MNSQAFKFVPALEPVDVGQGPQEGVLDQIVRPIDLPA